MDDDRGKKSQAGRKYFDELNTRFWELPGKYMSISYNIYIFYFNILYFLADTHDHEFEESLRVRKQRDARGGNIFIYSIYSI